MLWRRQKRNVNNAERVSLQQITVRARETGRPIPGRLGRAPDMPGPVSNSRPDPVYGSWNCYVNSVPVNEIRRWCGGKASVANRDRFMTGPPDRRIKTQDVYEILVSAKGRCWYCNSLCVEKCPRGPWASVGRRIGSLGHKNARLNGGGNTPDNLCWSCLWCNVWPSERKQNAIDRGAIL
jgi:hypothetical protein